MASANRASAKSRLAATHNRPTALATLSFCVLLAWVCLRFYDVPVRRWLTTRYMSKARKGVVAGAAVPE